MDTQDKSGRTPCRRRPLTGIAFSTLCISLIFFSAAACSREDPPRTKLSKKIVVPIKKPRWLTSQSASAAETEAMKDPPPAPKPAEKRPLAEKETKASPPQTPEGEGQDGVYRVKPGDTLLKIAAMQGVYGDPLKWPSLFRRNMGKLKGLGEDEEIERKRLPEGLELVFQTPSEAAKGLENLDRRRYAINVLSTQKEREIVPPALTLIKNGYHVYIARAEVKGQEWMRLRVGFFEDRSGAVVESKRIMSLLDRVETWIVKVRDEEVEEFGGY